MHVYLRRVAAQEQSHEQQSKFTVGEHANQSGNTTPKTADEGERKDIAGTADEGERRDTACCVPTDAPEKPSGKFYRPKPGSLSTIVRSYKSAVTKAIREYSGERDKIWQPRYHDHVVRDATDFDRIWRYIRENPAQWERDKFYRPDKLAHFGPVHGP
ncbi:MAG: hypothetical protein AAF125_08995 [Chloroflexota bacterium]